MDLWLPEKISLDEASTALLEDINETARRVNDHRPLPPEVVTRIDENLLGERVYSSNSIEGSTLDRRETVLILQRGIQGIKKQREAREAKNLGDAARLVDQWIKDGVDVHTLERLLELHGVLLKRIKDDWAGRLRERRVMIQGARHQPPDQSLVPELLDCVLKQLREPREEHVVLLAAWAHWAIARIHPFYDGNGRMARLWQDLILINGRLTCAIISPEGRHEYLDALMAADEGDFNPLVQIVSRRLAASFDVYLVELGKTAQFEEWISELAGEVDERSAERSRREYERWRGRMERLRREFELCAARLTDASETMRIQVRPYPIIEQTQWQNIRDGIGSSNTWFFTLDFSSRKKRKRYIFFFGKHFWHDDLDNERDRAEQRVTLLISEDAGVGMAERLDLLPNCPITIREVFVTDNQLICRRFDPETNAPYYDRDVSPLDLAKEFIRDVVLSRLGPG